MRRKPLPLLIFSSAGRLDPLLQTRKRKDTNKEKGLMSEAEDLKDLSASYYIDRFLVESLVSVVGRATKQEMCGGEHGFVCCLKRRRARAPNLSVNLRVPSKSPRWFENEESQFLSHLLWKCS